MQSSCQEALYPYGQSWAEQLGEEQRDPGSAENDEQMPRSQPRMTPVPPEQAALGRETSRLFLRFALGISGEGEGASLNL